MADMTDVADALVALITAAIYPSGTGSAPAGGVQCKIYQGWPEPKQLSTDLRALLAHVSVFPTATERVTDSMNFDWLQQSIAAPTLVLTVAGNTVTVSGTVSTGQNAALLVDGLPYVYAVQAGDTLTSIATALTALVSAARTASNVGPVITIPATHSLVARIGVQGVNFRVLRRQEKVFQVTVWANSPAQRETVAKIVDPTLSGAYRTILPDGTQATVRYKSSIQDDGAQKAGIFSRHMLFAVEYQTTDTVSATQIVIEQLGVSAQQSTGVQTGNVTVYS